MAYESSTGGSRTITAFFDDRSEADRAVSRLASAGISQDRIRLVPGQQPGTSTSSTSVTSQSEGGGGFWDALSDLFLPDEDRSTYAEGLRRGGYLVTVTASTAEYDRALDILDDEGTVDINERESTWRSEGWTGYTGGSSMSGTTGAMSGSGSSFGSTSTTGTGMSGSGSSSTTATRDLGSSDLGRAGTEEVIPVAEEELRIGKRDVSHGRVRVRSYTVETPVSESVNLREESVHVERRPVDRATTGSEGIFQDRTIEVEERGEEAVVSKEARVREELVINKEVENRSETVSDTVRRTEVEIDDERTGTDTDRITRSR
jgi:uncharacterized protein (TIGR02271 family)